MLQNQSEFQSAFLSDKDIPRNKILTKTALKVDMDALQTWLETWQLAFHHEKYVTTNITMKRSTDVHLA